MAASFERFSWSRADIHVEERRPTELEVYDLCDLHVVSSFVRKIGAWRLRAFDRAGVLVAAFAPTTVELGRGRATAEGPAGRWVVTKRGDCGC